MERTRGIDNDPIIQAYEELRGDANFARKINAKLAAFSYQFEDVLHEAMANCLDPDRALSQDAHIPLWKAAISNEAINVIRSFKTSSTKTAPDATGGDSLSEALSLEGDEKKRTWTNRFTSLDAAVVPTQDGEGMALIDTITDGLSAEDEFIEAGDEQERADRIVAAEQAWADYRDTLRNEQTKQIMDLRLEGVRYKEIANQVGVTPVNARQVASYHFSQLAKRRPNRHGCED